MELRGWLKKLFNQKASGKGGSTSSTSSSGIEHDRDVFDASSQKFSGNGKASRTTAVDHDFDLFKGFVDQLQAIDQSG